MATEERGLIAAGGFTPAGQLEGFDSTEGWNEARAAISARFAATGIQVLETIALGYQQLSGQTLTPARGWAYVGGDCAAVVRDGRWSVLRAAEAGFGNRTSGTLAELLERSGAQDVGETDAQGRLLAHETRIGLTEELAATGARFVHTVTGLTDGLAEIYSILSDLDWRPAAGWVYEGGDWFIAVGGRRWALVPAPGNDLADVARTVLW